MPTASFDPQPAPHERWTMIESSQTRRRFLKVAGGVAAAASVPSVFVRSARAKSDTLKIGQWTHFVPAFDEWFDKKYCPEWGAKNGVKVVVDHISVNDLRARAAAEVSAKKGHDLFGFLDPPPAYENVVVPMNDVVTECEKKYGKLANLAQHATFNPKTKKYFAVSDNWVPDPLHYRKDVWGEIGMKPDTWEHIREGSKKIKDKSGMPAGFGISQELDTNMMLRALLWSFGAQEQDESSTKVMINSKATVEAIKLMTAIYKESETAEVFTWDPSSNNRFFVSGKGHIIQNAISAIRTSRSRIQTSPRRPGWPCRPPAPAASAWPRSICCTATSSGSSPRTPRWPRSSSSISSALTTTRSWPASSTTSRRSPSPSATSRASSPPTRSIPRNTRSSATSRSTARTPAIPATPPRRWTKSSTPSSCRTCSRAWPRASSRPRIPPSRPKPT